MRLSRLPLVGMAGVVSLALVVGCEDKPSVDTSKSTEATVKGTVKVGGAPATEGEIVFDPTNYLRKDATIRTAPIGKDGTYEIKTLTGANSIRLSGALAKKQPQLQSEVRDLDVKAGENTFDFEAKEQ